MTSFYFHDVTAAERAIVQRAVEAHGATTLLAILQAARVLLADDPGLYGVTAVRRAAALVQPYVWGGVVLAEQALTRAAGATFDVWAAEPGRTRDEVLAVFDAAIAQAAAP